MPLLPQTAFSSHPRFCLYSHINGRSHWRRRIKFHFSFSWIMITGFPLITTVLQWPENSFRTLTKKLSQHYNTCIFISLSTGWQLKSLKSLWVTKGTKSSRVLKPAHPQWLLRATCASSQLWLQRCLLGGLILTMVEIFIPRKLENVINQGFFPAQKKEPTVRYLPVQHWVKTQGI